LDDFFEHTDAEKFDRERSKKKLVFSPPLISASVSALSASGGCLVFLSDGYIERLDFAPALTSMRRSGADKFLGSRRSSQWVFVGSVLIMRVVEALEDRRLFSVAPNQWVDGNVFRRAGLTQPVATRPIRRCIFSWQESAGGRHQ